MSLPVLPKSIAQPFETLMVILHSLGLRSKLLSYVCRYLTGRGYDGRAARIESQLDVTGRGKAYCLHVGGIERVK